jgi:hypothetical protein
VTASGQELEREATPRFLMKLGIQLHLAGLSLSNTVSILEKRSKTTNLFVFKLFQQRREKHC